MIQAKNIVKNFTSGEVVTEVLKNVDLEIPEGQFVSIVGSSGVGKSTLLYQMSLLDTPTSGEVFIDNQSVSNLNESEKTHFRLENFGFIFQDYALIPEFTALENALLPSLMLGVNYTKAKLDAIKIFESLGMAEQINHLPSQLSGGEQQRVSIIRAIFKKPKIVFADEPTANLDSVLSLNVINTLKKINEEEGQTIIMITHEENYAEMTDRIVRMKDGKILEDSMLK